MWSGGWAPLITIILPILMLTVPEYVHARDPILPLDLDQLQELCWEEQSLCHEKALNGDCFGKSLKAQVLGQKCKCSCGAAHHRRIQNCCRTVGRPEMKFCLPLCQYNTTNAEVCLIGGEYHIS